MEYVKLGSTELKVSRIGFGCWAIGGHGYGNVDEVESHRAIHKALDLGINFFDTADVYGFGHSEEVLGKGLGSRKNDVVVAAKFGVTWDENGKTHKDCSPKRVAKALEGSLQRLGVDCIDLYQIHWHDSVTPIAETISALERCRKEGKIRNFGCSNFSRELLEKAKVAGDLASLQCEYSVGKCDCESDMQWASEELKLGVICYGVLGRGVLTGKYGRNSEFGENDTREREESFRGPCLERNLNLVQLMKRMGEQYGKTVSQIAIRWVLDNRSVACALTGVKTVRQVTENCGALDWSLTDEHRAMLRAVGT